MDSEGLCAVARSVWDRVCPGYEGYALVEPSTPGFICQAQTCEAYCCKALSVPADARDARRMVALSGLELHEVLESVDGQPLELPLAHPYLLARNGGACRFLRADYACGQYEGRPAACRAYPYQVLFFDVRTGSQVHGRSRRAARALSGGSDMDANDCVPLLIRHTACPGFTGEPTGEAAWRALIREIADLQYPRA